MADQPTNIGSSLVSTAVDTALNTGKQFVSGFVNDYFARRAEKRMYERNRSLIAETPSLQVEGRRKAGLNPYDLEGAQLPGMSAQSDVRASASDLSHPATLNNLMAFERLDLDRLVAESTANRNNAEADRLRGQESRDVALFPKVEETYLVDIAGKKLSNDYQTIVNRIELATEGDKIERSKLSLQDLRDALKLNKQLIANANKQGKIMDASYSNLVEQGKVLRAELFAKEIANTLGVAKYERLTGLDYYTGEKIGPGLWDIEDARALADKDIVVAEKELREFFADTKEITFVLDSVLKGVEILDIVNDDVFQWKNEEDKRDFIRELQDYKEKREKRGKAFDFVKDIGKNGTFLLIRLLPYIIKYLS